MKKRIFLVAILVATALSTMFVACKKDEPKSSGASGCTCEFYDPEDGESWNEKVSSSEMKEYGVSDCGALSSAIKAESYGGDFSVRCHE